MCKILYDSLFSVIYAGIAGDIIGLPYEFSKRGDFFVLKKDIINDINNYSLAKWSDDTSLTLCLIKNIIDNGNEKDLLDKFVFYLEKGEYTPDGYVFGIGKTTKNAILRYKFGLSPKDCGIKDEASNGNGSLMRIAPLVFILRSVDDFAKRSKEVKKYSELTHAHPRSVLACIIYIETLLSLFNGANLDEAVATASKYCFYNLKGTEYENEFYNYDRIFHGSIKYASIETIQSTGYVVHTLEAALWSCFQSFSTQEAILTAVNLGGDTDTIASIAGSIAGMQYKNLDAFPSEWLSNIAKKKEIDELIEQFYRHLTR